VQGSLPVIALNQPIGGYVSIVQISHVLPPYAVQRQPAGKYGLPDHGNGISLPQLVDLHQYPIPYHELHDVAPDHFLH